MEASPTTPPARPVADSRSTLILLTAVTATLAWAADDPKADAVLRPLYFATLFAFFQRIASRHGGRLGLPLRIVCAGFLVLTLGFAVGAVVRQSGVDITTPLWAYVLVAMERGIVFLVGLGMVTYGTLLWVPQLLESQEVLRAGYGRARGQLALSEEARAALEARIEDAARLQAIGELAAGIAHDLRNPLTVVRGTAASLRRRPRDGAELEQHLDVIDRNLARAERTIQGLLDLGRPRDPRLEAIHLETVLAESLELVEAEARRRGVHLRASGSLEAPVMADGALVRRALVNLCLNAVQVSPHDAAVRIALREIRWRGVRTAVVTITDSGPGLPAGARAQLFKPFYTTRPGGTGLGLLSVRRTADELGGRVGLYPRRRGGCRAVFALPVTGSGSEATTQGELLTPAGAAP